MSEPNATWGDVRQGHWVWLDAWATGDHLEPGWHQVFDVAGGRLIPEFQFSTPDAEERVLRLFKSVRDPVLIRDHPIDDRPSA